MIRDSDIWYRASATWVCRWTSWSVAEHFSPAYTSGQIFQLGFRRFIEHEGIPSPFPLRYISFSTKRNDQTWKRQVGERGQRRGMVMNILRSCFIVYSTYAHTMSTKKTNSRSRFAKKKYNTCAHTMSTEQFFDLVQLVGITSTMCTCTFFLDPFIQGFLFVRFLGRSGVCGPRRRTEP